MSGQRYGEVQRVDHTDLWRKQRSSEPPAVFPGKGGTAPCLKDPSSSYIGKRSLVPCDKDLPAGPSFDYPTNVAPPPKDKGETYPPIVTIDGRVDTDLDKYVEDIYEDDYAGPVDDIPGRFPRPHVFSVIEGGSLDDDIDNYVNHDGTMEHTLVETPKKCHPSDLKDVASNDTQSRKQIGQTNRSYNKIDMYPPHEPLSDRFPVDAAKQDYEKGDERGVSKNEISGPDEDNKRINCNQTKETHDFSAEGGNESNATATDRGKGADENVPNDDSKQRLVTKPEFAHVRSVKEFFGLDSESDQNKGSHPMNLTRGVIISSSDNQGQVSTDKEMVLRYSRSFCENNSLEDHTQKMLADPPFVGSGPDARPRFDSDSELYDREHCTASQTVESLGSAGSDTNIVLENKVFDTQQHKAQKDGKLQKASPKETEDVPYSTQHRLVHTGGLEDTQNQAVAPFDTSPGAAVSNNDILPAPRDYGRSKSGSPPRKDKNEEKWRTSNTKFPKKEQAQKTPRTSPNMPQYFSTPNERQFSPQNRVAPHSSFAGVCERREEGFGNISSPGGLSTRCSTSAGILDQYSKSSTEGMVYDSEEYLSDFLKIELANMSLEKEPVYDQYSLKGREKTETFVGGKKVPVSAYMDDHDSQPEIVRYKANWKPVEKRKSIGSPETARQREEKHGASSKLSSPNTRQQGMGMKHAKANRLKPKASPPADDEIFQESGIGWDLAYKQLNAKAEEFQKIYSRRSRQKPADMAEIDRKYRDISNKYQCVRKSPTTTRKAFEKRSPLKSDKSPMHDSHYGSASVTPQDWNILSDALQGTSIGKRHLAIGNNENDRQPKRTREYCTCSKDNPKTGCSCNFKKKHCPHHASNKMGKTYPYTDSKPTKKLPTSHKQYCTCNVERSRSVSFSSSDTCVDIGENKSAAEVYVRERKGVHEKYRRAASVPRRLEYEQDSKSRPVQERILGISQIQTSGAAEHDHENSANKTIKETLRAAMKVAGESIAAAARIAEVLSLVVKASKLSPPYSLESSVEDKMGLPKSPTALCKDTLTNIKARASHSSSPNRSKSKSSSDRKHSRNQSPILRKQVPYENTKESHILYPKQGSNEKKTRSKLVNTVQCGQTQQHHSSKAAVAFLDFTDKSPKEIRHKKDVFALSRNKGEKFKPTAKSVQALDTGMNLKSDVPNLRHRTRTCGNTGKDQQRSPRSPQVTIQISSPLIPDKSPLFENACKPDKVKHITYEDTPSRPRTQDQKVSGSEVNPRTRLRTEAQKQVEGNIDIIYGAEKMESNHNQAKKMVNHKSGIQRKKYGFHDKTSGPKNTNNGEYAHAKTNAGKILLNQVERLDDDKCEKRSQSVAHNHKSKTVNCTENLAPEHQKQILNFCSPTDEPNFEAKGRRSKSIDRSEKPRGEAGEKQVNISANTTNQPTEEGNTTVDTSSRCCNQIIYNKAEPQKSPKADKEEPKLEDYQPQTYVTATSESSSARCKISSGYESYHCPLLKKIRVQMVGTCVDPANPVDDGYLESLENSNFNKSLQENWTHNSDVYYLGQDQQQQGFKHDWEKIHMDDVYESLLRSNTDALSTTPDTQKSLGDKNNDTPPRGKPIGCRDKDNFDCFQLENTKFTVGHRADRSAPDLGKAGLQVSESSLGSSKNENEVDEGEYHQATRCPWMKDHTSHMDYLYSQDHLNTSGNRHISENQPAPEQTGNKRPLRKKEYNTYLDSKADPISGYDCPKKYSCLQEYTTQRATPHETGYSGFQKSSENPPGHEKQPQCADTQCADSRKTEGSERKLKSVAKDFPLSKEHSKSQGNLRHQADLYPKKNPHNNEPTQSSVYFHYKTYPFTHDDSSEESSSNDNQNLFSKECPNIFDQENLFSKRYPETTEKTDNIDKSCNHGYPQNLKYSNNADYQLCKVYPYSQEYSRTRTKGNSQPNTFQFNQNLSATKGYPKVKTEEYPQCKQNLDSQEHILNQKYLHHVQYQHTTQNDEPKSKEQPKTQVYSSNVAGKGFTSSDLPQGHENPDSSKCTRCHKYQRRREQLHSQIYSRDRGDQQTRNNLQDQKFQFNQEYLSNPGQLHCQEYTRGAQYSHTKGKAQSNGNPPLQLQGENQQIEVPNGDSTSCRELENSAGIAPIKSGQSSSKGHCLPYGKHLRHENYYQGHHFKGLSSCNPPSKEAAIQIQENQTPGLGSSKLRSVEQVRETKSPYIGDTNIYHWRQASMNLNKQDGSEKYKQMRPADVWYEPCPNSLQCLDKVANYLRPSQIYATRERAEEDISQEPVVEQLSDKSTRQITDGLYVEKKNISPNQATVCNGSQNMKTINDISIGTSNISIKKEHLSPKSQDISYNEIQNLNTNNGNVYKHIKSFNTEMKNKRRDNKYVNTRNEKLYCASQDRNKPSCRNFRCITKRKTFCTSAKYYNKNNANVYDDSRCVDSCNDNAILDARNTSSKRRDIFNNRSNNGLAQSGESQRLSNETGTSENNEGSSIEDSSVINVLDGFNQTGTTQEYTEVPRLRHHNDIVVKTAIKSKKKQKVQKVHVSKHKSCKLQDTLKDDDQVLMCDRGVGYRNLDSNVSHVLYEPHDTGPEATKEDPPPFDATFEKVDEMEVPAEHSNFSEALSQITFSKTEKSRQELGNEILTGTDENFDKIPFEPPSFLVERMEKTQPRFGKVKPEPFGEVYRNFKLPPVVKLHPVASKKGLPSTWKLEDWTRYHQDTTLIGRLAKIKRGKSTIDTGQDYAPVPKVSMRSLSRLGEQELIARTNEAIFQRLLSSVSVYSREEQLKDYERKLPILAGMARHPQNVKLPAMSSKRAQSLKEARANLLVKEQTRAIDEYYGFSGGFYRGRFPTSRHQSTSPMRHRLLTQPSFDKMPSRYSRDEFERDYQKQFKIANPHRRLSEIGVKRMAFKPKLVDKKDNPFSTGFSVEKPQRGSK